MTFCNVYMRIVSLLPVLLCAGAVLGGCATASEKTDKKNADEHQLKVTAIKESFTQLADAMATGNMDKVKQYVSAQEWDRNPFPQFAQEYEQNKMLWQAMFRGAYLKTIGIDNNVASAIVIWGTSESALVEFIWEDNIWKLLNMSLPAPVLTPSGSAQPPIPE